jgi:hypothetical protein
MTKQWDKQQGETSKAFAAFVTYRDMGPERTQEKTAKALGRPPGYMAQLGGWSVSHRWVARCEAYDAFMDKQVQAAAVKEYQRMGERQAKMLISAQSMLATSVSALAMRSRKLKDDAHLQGKAHEGLPEELAGLPLSILFDLFLRSVNSLPNIMRMERLARGDADAEVNVKGGIAITAGSDDMSGAFKTADMERRVVTGDYDKAMERVFSTLSLIPTGDEGQPDDEGAN